MLVDQSLHCGPNLGLGGLDVLCLDSVVKIMTTCKICSFLRDKWRVSPTEGAVHRSHRGRQTRIVPELKI